jgi:hypothetical protein
MGSLLMVQDSKEVQGFGVVLLAREYPLVQLGRGAQLPRSMHLDGRAQDVLHDGRKTEFSESWSIIVPTKRPIEQDYRNVFFPVSL